MQGAWLAILLWVIAYLFGSISSAVAVSHFFRLPDPRTHGSNNPGATNVLRLAGAPYAAMVLIFDVLKGLLPVLLACMWSSSIIIVSITSFFAVLGHMYPVFFRFEGGKGVATAIGAFFGLNFILGVLVLATWLVVVRVSRYSSLAAVVSIGLAPFYGLWIIRSPDVFVPLFLIAVFVLFRHRANVSRLIDGVEPKIFNRVVAPAEVKASKAKVSKKKAPKAKTKAKALKVKAPKAKAKTSRPKVKRKQAKK